MGVAPTVAEDDGDAGGETPESPDDEAEMAADAGSGKSPDGPDEMAEVELSEDDVDADGADELFTSTEDKTDDTAESDESGDESESSDDESGGPDLLGDGLDGRAGRLEERVNESMARMAVVGLDDEYKMEDDDDTDCLEAEFRDVFDLAGVGYHSAEFVDEYILTGDQEQVDPAFGLLGSVLACAALVVYLRPDGDEKLADAKDAISNIGGLA